MLNLDVLNLIGCSCHPDIQTRKYQRWGKCQCSKMKSLLHLPTKWIKRKTLKRKRKKMSLQWHVNWNKNIWNNKCLQIPRFMLCLPFYKCRAAISKSRCKCVWLQRTYNGGRCLDGKQGTKNIMRFNWGIWDLTLLHVGVKPDS